jgi:hypothetical protein
MKNTIGRTSANSDIEYDDFTYPEHLVNARERNKKPKITVVYCTSYSCNTPKNNRAGDSCLKERIIENPPKNGWCPYCGSALFHEERSI